MSITEADIWPYVYAFSILGGLCVLLGFFFRGRIDGLIDDPKLPDRLDDDERQHRGSQLYAGVWTLFAGGIFLLLGALMLYIWFI